jgi:hypothetical protein
VVGANGGDVAAVEGEDERGVEALGDSGEPVLHRETGDAVEVADVGCDERQVVGEGDRGDAQVGLVEAFTG